MATFQAKGQVFDYFYPLAHLGTVLKNQVFQFKRTWETKNVKTIKFCNNFQLFTNNTAQNSASDGILNYKIQLN